MTDRTSSRTFRPTISRCLGLLLAVLWLSLPSGSAQAQDLPDAILWEEGLPEVLAPLLRHPLSELDEPTRLKAAELMARRGFPRIATHILPEPTKEGDPFARAVVRGYVAKARGHVGEVASACRELIALFPSSGEGEKTLTELLSWLRERGGAPERAVELGELSSRHDDRLLLRAEAMAWARRAGGLVRTDELARRAMENCPDTVACLGWVDYFAMVPDPTSQRLALMRAWRTLKTPEDREAVIHAAIRAGMRARALEVIPSWLSDLPSVSACSRMCAALPEAWPLVREDVGGRIATMTSRERWEWVRLAWRQGDVEWVHHLLPEEHETLSGLDELLESAHALAEISQSPRPKADTEPWRRRLDGLLRRAERMELSPAATASLLLLLAPHAASVDRAVLRALATSVVQTRTEMGAMLAGLGLLRAGDEEGARVHLEPLLEDGGSGLRVAELIAAPLNDYAPGSGDLRRRVAVLLKAAYPIPDGVMDRALCAERLRDRDVLAAIMRDALSAELDPWQRLDLCRLALRHRLYSEGQRLLMGLGSELAADAALVAMDLWFGLNAHEEALRLSYRLENDSEIEPLLLARLLTAPYRAWRDGLMGVQRRTRVSLDIYTQLIVRSVRRHLDAMGSASDWPEAVAVLHDLEAIPRLNDTTTDPRLRLAYHQVREDLDGAVFEVYQRFLEGGPQPAPVWGAMMRELSRLENPDFVTVAWDRLRGTTLDAESLFDLAIRLVSRPRADVTPLTDEVMGRWRMAARRLDYDRHLLRMAFWLSAVAGEAAARGDIRREVLEARRVRLDRLHDDLRSLEEGSLDGESAPLPALDLERTDGTRETSADAILKALEDRRWLLHDCLRGQVPGKDSRVVRVSVVTDAKGRVDRLNVGDLPPDKAPIRECLETRLSALTIENVDPPFGHVELALVLRGNGNGGEAHEGVGELLRLVRREARLLATWREDLLRELQDVDDIVATRRNLAHALALAGIASSWDARVYHEAAWWLEHVAGDERAAVLLRRQARWVGLAPLLPWAGVLLVLGWAVWRIQRRRKGPFSH